MLNRLAMVDSITILHPFDKVIITERLIMRRLKETDDGDMFEYTSIAEVSKYLSWEPHTDISQATKYIKSIIDQYSVLNSYTWAIELKEIHKFIGIVRAFDISNNNKRLELSYILNPSYQGKGLAMEAIRAVIDFCFKELGLNRIQARCTPDNDASRKLIQRLGMIYEGTLRGFWVNKGIVTDAAIFGITKYDYLDSNRINK